VFLWTNDGAFPRHISRAVGTAAAGMQLTADLVASAPAKVNAIMERELPLRSGSAAELALLCERGAI
jgi:hypothetical protein